MPDALTDRTRRFIELLFAKTVGAELEWTPGFGNNTYETNLAGYTVQVFAYDDGSDEGAVGVIVRDTLGNMVDRIYEDTLKDQVPQHPDFRSYIPLMSRLYKTAERQALGAEVVLDKLIQQLEKKTASE